MKTTKSDNGLHNSLNFEDKDIYFKIKVLEERNLIEKQTYNRTN